MLYEFDTFLTTTTSTTTSIEISTEATNEQLMARLREGDESALSALCQRHRGILRTVIARVIHNDADVDDLMQELMIEVWNRAKSYDETKGKVLGWLVTMARRRAIDRVRRRQAYDRAEERLRLHVEDNSQAVEVPSVEEQAMSADRSAFLRQMLETLPEAQKEAVQLAFYRGLSQREISAQTGIPLGTIKTRLELAIRKLRANITALGAEDWGMTAAC